MSRILSKTFAIALAAGVAVASPTAVAAPGDSTTPAETSVNRAPSAPIDINRTGSLTIDKREGELESEKKLGGMKFKVEQVEMKNSLDTAAGWKEAGELVENGAADAPLDGYSAEKTTDTDGQAKFSGLKVGVYKVTELPSEKAGYTVGSPFLVTIPLTSGDGSIDYDPVVSPKNQRIQPKKTSEDNNVAVGENIGYTITAPVPGGDVNRDGQRTIPKLKVTDALKDYLEFADEADQVEVTAKGVDLKRNFDYVVDINKAEGEPQLLTVEFTEAGLGKLAAAREGNVGLAVEIKFDARVKNIPANGKIENTAFEDINDSSEPIPSTPDENAEGPTTTHYGDVVITKTLNGNATEDNGGNTINGSGAEFQVFECESDGDDGVSLKSDVPVNGASEDGTEKADATLTAQGEVPSAAAANGYFLQLDPNKEYCAVETKAPAGYLVNPDPQPLTASEERRGGTGEDDGRIVYTATVDDVKDNIWGKLPATGMRTMLIILGLGALLFIGGAAYQLKRRNA